MATQKKAAAPKKAAAAKKSTAPKKAAAKKAATPKKAEFKADARDGDGDGFVQDGTDQERPVELKSAKTEKAPEAAKRSFWKKIFRKS